MEMEFGELTPPQTPLPASVKNVPSVSTQPEVTTPPDTPLPTPTVKVCPTRFDFENVPSTSTSSQESAVPGPKDHIIEMLKKRIAELEQKERDQSLYVQTLKKCFHQDSIDKGTGIKQRVNWSNETIEESLEDRHMFGSTGYEHFRGKFPGMFPSRTCQNQNLKKNMKVPFGIIEDSFKLLELTAKKKHSKQKYITLIMDEIAIKECVEYDPSLKCLTGAITMPLGSDATIDDGKTDLTLLVSH